MPTPVFLLFNKTNNMLGPVFTKELTCRLLNILAALDTMQLFKKSFKIEIF